MCSVKSRTIRFAPQNLRYFTGIAAKIRISFKAAFPLAASLSAFYVCSVSRVKAKSGRFARSFLVCCLDMRLLSVLPRFLFAQIFKPLQSLRNHFDHPLHRRRAVRAQQPDPVCRADQKPHGVNRNARHRQIRQ